MSLQSITLIIQEADWYVVRPAHSRVGGQADNTPAHIKKQNLSSWPFGNVFLSQHAHTNTENKENCIFIAIN